MLQRSLNPYSNGIYSTRLLRFRNLEAYARGLNPYSNGIYSTSLSLTNLLTRLMRLNPYSNGIYSTSDANLEEIPEYKTVLILILMEYTQRDHNTYNPHSQVFNHA